MADASVNGYLEKAEDLLKDDGIEDEKIRSIASVYLQAGIIHELEHLRQELEWIGEHRLKG